MGKCLAVVAWTWALILLATGAAGADARSERAAARAAEKKQDWDAALLHYENLFDSTQTDETTRGQLRAKFLELRPKVAPNSDPAKAGVWKVQAYAFRNLQVTRNDKDGKEHQTKQRFRDDEIAEIRAAMKGFAAEVWKNATFSIMSRASTMIASASMPKSSAP